ncbi:hypothetical protein [Saccharopolyspora gregorii]|uniref:hypothetical protein n=1 Tax=Saccharopolyspora gregorii TaxID=33914 RepID=UPI0031E847DE
MAVQRKSGGRAGGAGRAEDAGIRPQALGRFAVRWAEAVAALRPGAAVDPGLANPRSS